MVWFAFTLLQVFIGTSEEFCALPGSHDLLDLSLHSCKFSLVLLRNCVHSPDVTICLVCLLTRVGFNWYFRGVCGLVCLHTRVVSSAATTPHDSFIAGDFNIHTDNHSDLHSQQFLFLLNNANLTRIRCFRGVWCFEKNVGDGTAFLIHDFSTIVSTSSEIKSFEISSSTTKLLKSKLTAFNIYRNHYQINTPTHDHVPFSDFLIDFQTFISTAATTPHDFLITGDFNIHTDNHSDLHSQQFLSLLNNANSLNMSTFLLIRLVTHLMMSSLQKTQLYHPQLLIQLFHHLIIFHFPHL